MTVEKIIEKVQDEALKKEPKLSDTFDKQNQLNENKNLNIYQISDFTKYDDEEFIDNIYQMIFNRQVDLNGKLHYLSKLRDGTLTKTQIITTLYFSKEGRDQDITILGAKKRHIITLLLKLPIIKTIAKYYNNTKKIEIKTILNKESDFDKFYLAFEDKFRGSTHEIKERLKVYLPYVNSLSNNKKDISILDLGCGRGEWLEILKEDGYTNLKGIDLNSSMVRSSKKIGLDVECIDALSYLSSLKDNTLDLVSGFHIIEHLPFNIMRKFIQESHRVIKYGGMVLYETPNPRNILVGSSDFYMDPTHQTPIHPETLKFTLEYYGFINVTLCMPSQDSIVKYDDIKFDSLDDYVKIGRDLAVIGYKI